jgi:hypothetical protein
VLQVGERAQRRPRAEVGQWRGQRGACGKRQRGELGWLSTVEQRVGAARNRRWCRSGCNDGEQRRSAVRAGGRAAWQGEEMASMGWGSARGARKGSTGAAGRRREETEEERG